MDVDSLILHIDIVPHKPEYFTDACARVIGENQWNVIFVPTWKSFHERAELFPRDNGAFYNFCRC